MGPRKCIHHESIYQLQLCRTWQVKTIGLSLFIKYQCLELCVKCQKLFVLQTKIQHKSHVLLSRPNSKTEQYSRCSVTENIFLVGPEYSGCFRIEKAFNWQSSHLMKLSIMAIKTSCDLMLMRAVAVFLSVSVKLEEFTSSGFKMIMSRHPYV